ncbi:MAG: aminotransferase class IV [Desulfotomaculum sp.]|nr:aminotransferase class IV [Desulfotomaculum sp.]
MPLVSVDGCIIKDTELKISPLSLGLSYGFSLFETMLVSGRGPIFFHEHMERLRNSAEFFNLSVPEPPVILRWLMDLINVNGITEGKARISLISNNKGVGTKKLSTKLIIFAEKGIPYCEELYKKGLEIGFLSYKKNQNSIIVKHKTANYLENILGQQEAATKGWAEGLFLNNEDYVAEGTKSNIFIVKNSQLLTPDTGSGILPGITRAKVMDIAREQGIVVQEKKVTVKEIFEAGECFICNSLMGIMPVKSIDNTPVGKSTPGCVTAFLRQKYMERLKN